MPEMTTVAIIAGVSVLLFGSGIFAAARVLTGRKKKSVE